MSARAKLNSAHFAGSMLIAGGVGMWFNSFVVFAVVAAIFLATNLASGAIRMEPQKRR